MRHRTLEPMPRACRFKFDEADQSQLLRRGNELLTGVPFDLNGPLTIAEPMKITSFNINDISRRLPNLLNLAGRASGAGVVRNLGISLPLAATLQGE